MKPSDACFSVFSPFLPPCLSLFPPKYSRFPSTSLQLSLSPILPPCHPLPFPPFPSLFPFVLHSLLLLHIYWVFILLHSLIPPLLPIPPTLLLPTYPPPSLSSTSYIIILLLLCSLSLLILIFVFSFILRFFSLFLTTFLLLSVSAHLPSSSVASPFPAYFLHPTPPLSPLSPRSPLFIVLFRFPFSHSFIQHPSLFYPCNYIPPPPSCLSQILLVILSFWPFFL